MAKNKSTKPRIGAHEKPRSIERPDTSFQKPGRTFFSGRNLILAYVFLFAVVVVVFLPAIRNDFFYWFGDDTGYVTENAHVKSGLTLEGVEWAFRNIDLGNWHPLTFLSHMLDCQIYGLKPWGHHLTNVLIHAINAVLLFIVLRRMTGAMWRSLAVALLFGLQPMARSISTLAPKPPRARKPTGSPLCPKRAGSPASAYTVRSNHGSTRPGDPETSNW
jgi:hypothetical protein